jgi:hypothetical protein
MSVSVILPLAGKKNKKFFQVENLPKLTINIVKKGKKLKNPDSSKLN